MPTTLSGHLDCQEPARHYLALVKSNVKKLVVDSGFQPYEGVYKDIKDAPAK